MRSEHSRTITTVSVFGFAVAGAVSRYTRRTTETRWQIAAFTALAAGIETIARFGGPDRASAVRGALNAGAAAIVITSVKFHLEPAARVHGRALVRHVAKTIVRAGTDTQ
jgi:hypothetical protein